jgi:NAD(P)-dependent dehydrogenase (short-subunit alcohol dehydrogenase family)
MPLPSRSPYNATMHAVVGVTETLNVELRSVSPLLGATVLCPGLVNTALGATSAALVPPGAASTPENSGEITGGIEPALVADAAFEAVEADRVHAVVGPGAADVARQRVDALLGDLG